VVICKKKKKREKKKMKKMNKKGFTLIELLAVIVILGVLLLIGVPAVQNIIASSRERSYKSSINLAIENVETLASVQKLDGGLFTGASISTCYVLLSEINTERGNFGNSPRGYIVVGSDGKGTAYVANDAYSAIGKINNLAVGSSISITEPTVVGAGSKVLPEIKDSITTYYAANTTTEKCAWWR